MKGRIFQRPNQKAKGQGWTWCVDLPQKPGEQRHQVSGTSRTKREAEAAVARVVADGTSHLRRDDPGNITVANYLSEWLNAHATRVTPTTIERYSGIVHDHIVPAMGRKKLAELTPRDIDKFITTAQQPEKGSRRRRQSARSAQQFFAVLHKSFGDAVRHGIIEKNPCENVNRPRPRKPRFSVLTVDETLRLVEVAKSSRHFAAILLAAFGGLRRGEALAARWEDLDLQAGVLLVWRSLEQTKAGLRIKSTKEDEVHYVALPQIAVQLLTDYRRQQEEERRLFGVEDQGEGLIACRLDGSPFKPDTFSSSWRCARNRAGVKPVRFHDLRHGVAVLGLRSGVPLKIMSRLLGHATAGVTADIYQDHIDLDMLTDAAKRIDAAFGMDSEAANSEDNVPNNDAS